MSYKQPGPAEFYRQPEDGAPRPTFDPCPYNGNGTGKHAWNGNKICRACSLPLVDALSRTRMAQDEWDAKYGSSSEEKQATEASPYECWGGQPHEFVRGVHHCVRCGVPAATHCDHEWDLVKRVCVKCGTSQREAAFQKEQEQRKGRVPRDAGMTLEEFSRYMGAKAEAEVHNIVHSLKVAKDINNVLHVLIGYDYEPLGMTGMEAEMEIAGFMSQFDLMYEAIYYRREQPHKETTYSKTPPGYADFKFKFSNS